MLCITVSLASNTGLVHADAQKILLDSRMDEWNHAWVNKISRFILPAVKEFILNPLLLKLLIALNSCLIQLKSHHLESFRSLSVIPVTMLWCSLFRLSPMLPHWDNYIVIATTQNGVDLHPKFGSDVKIYDTTPSQESMKMFITHVMRLSGKANVAPKKVWNGLKFLWWLSGGAGVRDHVLGQRLVWFELPVHVKWGSIQAFLSTCPDMGQ